MAHITFCDHDRDNWTETDDNCIFCEDCGIAVCGFCGAQYQEAGIGMDTGTQYFDVPCFCAEGNHGY